MLTFRESVEESLLTIPEVRPLQERMTRYIQDFKDGTFGLSYLGYLLYCNGRNPRGLSRTNSKGLAYFDSENLFGIGVFRRETENGKGHLMVVAPRGLNSGIATAVELFAKKAVKAAPQLQGQLLYVRFLKSNQYGEFLKKGFSPVAEQPWHPEAFAEDETYNHAIIHLENILDFSARNRKQIKIFNSSKRNRQAFNRFENFLKRYGIEWKTDAFSSVEDARSIVTDHFRMLKQANKQIGSVPEDYWNILEANKKGRFAVIMKVCKGGKELPASVFVGEKISKNRVALYCTISRRDQTKYQRELNLPAEELIGFNGLSVYSFIKAFVEIKKQFPEIEEVHLGGSETPELNAYKRRLGSTNAPTYWVCKKL